MTKEESIKITLPIPPSLNWLYTWIKRRRKSDEYKDWISSVDVLFSKMDTKYTIHWNNWLEVEYEYFFSIYNKDWSIKKKDVFNYEKALSDVLTKHIKGFEDEKIKRWFVEKHDSEENTVNITIREIA